VWICGLGVRIDVKVVISVTMTVAMAKHWCGLEWVGVRGALADGAEEQCGDGGFESSAVGDALYVGW